MVWCCGFLYLFDGVFGVGVVVFVNCDRGDVFGYVG